MELRLELLFRGFFIVFLFSIALRYYHFYHLTNNKFKVIQVSVVNQDPKYNKNGKKYTVLKLKGDFFHFYTTTYEDLKNLIGKKISLTLITKKITFLSFLKGFYAISFNISLLPNQQNKINSLIYHNSLLLQDLFLALFTAKPATKILREKISNFGLSHLIALSGYHLGLLGGFLFFIFSLFYKIWHKNFPYRNKVFDLDFLILMVLFFYLAFVDFPPSLVRAYVMFLLGYVFLINGIKLISFKTLFLTFISVLSIFPEFIFNIGFWLSIAGVFYIFLYLKYFQKQNKITIFLMIPFYMFFIMNPVVHFFFYKFTYFQLLSPLISLIFTLFYPVEIFLHLIGYANLFDHYLLDFLTTNMQIFFYKTPLWFFILFICISFASMYKKIFFYTANFLSLAFFIYNLPYE